MLVPLRAGSAELRPRRGYGGLVQAVLGVVGRAGGPAAGESS